MGKIDHQVIILRVNNIGRLHSILSVNNRSNSNLNWKVLMVIWWYNHAPKGFATNQSSYPVPSFALFGQFFFRQE
jgi:hypothetical protein